MKKLILLLLVLYSCNKNDDCDSLYDYKQDFCDIYLYKNYIIDNNFTNEERFLIIDAFKSWQIITNNHFMFYNTGFISHKEILDINPPNIAIIKLTKDFDKNKIQELETIMGLDIVGDAFENLIYLFSEKIRKDTFKIVAIHEIGHIIGLPGNPHIDDNDSIMTKYVTHNQCILERELPTIVDYQSLKKLYCK